MDAMVTPAMASETYLQVGGSKYKTETEKTSRCGAQPSLRSHPFLKNTDQPLKNFGSLVKRRTANSVKKKEMEASAKLKHSSAKEKR